MPSRNRLYFFMIVGLISKLLISPFYTFSQYLNSVNETPLQFEHPLVYSADGEYLTNVTVLFDSNWVDYGWNTIQFKQYDSDLNTIKETRFQDSTFVYQQGTSIGYINDEYYFSGWRLGLFNSGAGQGYVVKYDNEGNLVWLNTYFPSVEETKVEHLKIINDRIYIAGPYRDISNSIQHTFLSELDTDGNILFTKIFDFYDNCTTTKLHVTSDGFLFSNIYSAQGTNLRVVLYKLDYDGNTQWQKTYGITGSWMSQNLAPLELPDGRLLLYGAQTHPQTEQGGSWVLLTDNQGNVIKDTVYHFTLYNDAFIVHYSPPILRENDFLILGGEKEEFASPTNAFLACIDYDLNVKWKRTFGQRESGNFLTFIHDLGNDFYLLSGRVDNDANHPTTDEWFVVVDSMGCDVTDCYLGLVEQQNETIMFTVYPNPASDNFTIQLQGNQNFSALHYKLMDMTGKVIQQGDVCKLFLFQV
jgi:hypothetical protein